MKFNYEVCKNVKEKKSIEIENTRNVFLEGQSTYNGLENYFGVWSNKKYLSIITLMNNGTIYCNCSLNKSVYPDCSIRRFLEDNKNVRLISKDAFIHQLNKYK